MSTLLTERSRTLLASSLALLLCLLVSACGSNLDPNDVARTGGSGTGTGAGQAAGGPLAPGGTDPASTGGAAVDPAAGSGSGSGSGSGTGSGTGTGSGSGSGSSSGSNGSGGNGGGGGGGGDDAPGAPEDVPEENSATGDGPQGTCDGFKNQTGITDSTITIANASDLTGPVPGLFLAARQGTEAFAAYFNATQKLCGRSLKVLGLDSKADAAADQQAYAAACTQAFAAVGSVSSADAGGAKAASDCGLPDIRSFSVTPERQACRTCYSAYSISTSSIADSMPKYWLKNEPDASQHVGVYYVDVPAAKANADAFAKGYEKAGMNVDVVQAIGTTEFNFAPYVQTMKAKNLQFIQYFGPYQFAIKLQKAMQQQQYKPTVYLEDATIYDANYLNQAGGAGEGSYVYMTNDLFTAQTTEMKLYRTFLEQVAPGAVPNWYGLYAWSATRLFVEQATALGGKLDRASLVQSVGKVKDWTGKGVNAPMAVGAKTTSPCIKLIRLTGSDWKQVSPGNYMCGGLIGGL